MYSAIAKPSWSGISKAHMHNFSIILRLQYIAINEGTEYNFVWIFIKSTVRFTSEEDISHILLRLEEDMLLILLFSRRSRYTVPHILCFMERGLSDVALRMRNP